jgi:hypothetical protein
LKDKKNIIVRFKKINYMLCTCFYYP